MSDTFQALGLAPELLDTVTELGYIKPTPIQIAAIPHLLAGRDVMGQAQTGTGKTAAFTLPMLQQLAPKGLQTLILAPTRELAIQTAEAVYRYGSQQGVRVLPVYGGQSYERQKRRLKKGVHVVVGTPGRTLDLIKQRVLKLHDVRFVVLDEADEMLKMGFIEDVEAILAATNAETRQTSLFTATLPEAIRRLARNYMHDPEIVAVKAQTMTVENVTQRYYVVREGDKVAALSRLLEVEDLHNTLIFTRTKVGAAQLAETLQARGYPAQAIHGDLPQNERERILGRFRTGHLTILVATDVVARGVDISDVSHVINFDIPQLGIEYVHRIGRTGRAGRAGDAITLITPRQRKNLKQIEHYTHQPITKGQLPDRESVLRQREMEFGAQLVTQMTRHAGDNDYVLLGELMEQGFSAQEIAAATLRLLRAGDDQRPLEEIRPAYEKRERSERKTRQTQRNGNGNGNGKRRNKRDRNGHEAGMVRLYMDVGDNSGLRPGDVVYTVASRANIPGRVLGAIDIRKYETYVDVPEAHVDAVLDGMQGTKIRGRALTLVRAEGAFEAQA